MNFAHLLFLKPLRLKFTLVLIAVAVSFTIAASAQNIPGAITGGITGLLDGLVDAGGTQEDAAEAGAVAPAATKPKRPAVAKPKPGKQKPPGGSSASKALPRKPTAGGKPPAKTTTPTSSEPQDELGPQGTNSASKCHYRGDAPTPLAVVTAPAAASRTPEKIASTVPWNVLVQAPGTGHYCSAMAVNNMWLLTAAHCLKGDAEAPIRDNWVAVSSLSQFTVNLEKTAAAASANIVSIVKAVVHPQFSYENDFTPDLALLKLSAPIPDIVPACIAEAYPKEPDSKANLARKCVVYGWEKPASKTQENVRTLNMILSEQQTNATCARTLGAIYGRGIYDSTRSICVAAPESKQVKNYCISTAGTGLLCNVDGKDKSTWTLEGLFAYGNMCLGKDYPGVFVKLAAFK